jgi:hypothetical protein
MESIFYEFGPFRVDLGERVVRRDGNLLPLTPKVFDILWVLIKNPGRILTKEEIMKQVWPDRIVEESNLARNVSTLRRELGEEPDRPQYIETIPFYAALGENDHAFERLYGAYRERSPEIVSLKVDPSFDNLHSDPRFQNLLARVGLAQSQSI